MLQIKPTFTNPIVHPYIFCHVAICLIAEFGYCFLLRGHYANLSRAVNFSTLTQALNASSNRPRGSFIVLMKVFIFTCNS